MRNRHTFMPLRQILIAIFAVFYCVQTFAQAPTYHIGDLYTDPDGNKGIIFYIKPDGGGWIVALTDRTSSIRWGDISDVLTPITSADQFGSQSDGYANTATLRSIFSSNYAANVVDFNNGWYLPSEEQLSILFASLSEIYTKFELYGGVVPNRCYWSSTPYNSNKAWVMNFRTDSQSGERYTYRKNDYLPVREVRNFSCEYPVLMDSTLRYQWNTGDTTWNIEVHPEVTTTYYVVATNIEGDKDTAFYELPVHPTYNEEENMETCDSYTWHFHTYTESGTYTYNGNTCDHGCDSIITLNLIINYSDTVHLYEEACGGYQWNGIVYDSSGVYEQNFQTVHGCDSTVYLHLEIHPNYFENEHVNICISQLPYTWRDTIFGIDTKTQIDTFFKHSIYGCDSIVVLQLNVYENRINRDTVVACGSYHVQDTTIYDSGDYELYYDIPGAECDSMVILTLTINSQQEVIIKDTACDMYHWRDSIYTRTGDYYHTETNQSGCDSVLHLQLFIKHSAVKNFTGEVCKGDDYIDAENGFVVTHTDTMNIGCNDIEFYCGQSASGCDSIRILHLYVQGKDIYLHSTKDTICFNEQDSVTIEVKGENYSNMVPTSCPVPLVAIGDILCTDGRVVKPADFDSNIDVAKGVVFFVDASGMHGWVVALNEYNSCKWSSSAMLVDTNNVCSNIRAALRDTSAYSHTRAILNFHNFSYTNFPVLEGLVINEGWYLPTAGQLRELFANILIVNQSLQSLPAGSIIDTSDPDKCYWSSTERNKSKAFLVYVTGELLAFNKNNSSGERRFVCSF